jgi:hypothetical protein
VELPENYFLWSLIEFRNTRFTQLYFLLVPVCKQKLTANLLQMQILRQIALCGAYMRTPL